MATLNVAVQDSGIVAALARLRSAISDLTPVFERIGATLERNANIRFDTKTDPSGKHWQQWAPSTAKARKAEGRGTLLEYTGRMRDSLTYKAGTDNVEIGFGVPYAKFHELGLGVPRRSMLLDGNGLGKQDSDDIFKTVQTYLQQTLIK